MTLEMAIEKYERKRERSARRMEAYRRLAGWLRELEGLRSGGRWIPVEEASPAGHETYNITYGNRTGLHCDSAVYNPSLKKWFWDESEETEVARRIYAWRPLPEPYRPPAYSMAAGEGEGE
ncbi:hypothetical protein [Otoolea muris]|uniref:hypothetical protein n=1 Tax=Otoolea muris TaxID=2941515 RepID=UPI00203E728D|nr:hypothetical protein [Otoolea muris]